MTNTPRAAVAALCAPWVAALSVVLLSNILSGGHDGFGSLEISIAASYAWFVVLFLPVALLSTRNHVTHFRIIGSGAIVDALFSIIAGFLLLSMLGHGGGGLRRDFFFLVAAFLGGVGAVVGAFFSFASGIAKQPSGAVAR